MTVALLGLVTPVTAGVSTGPAYVAVDQAHTVPAPAPADAATGPCPALGTDAAAGLAAVPVDDGGEINFTPVSGDRVFSTLPQADGQKPHFRGYCPCGCSVIKDCNTSADCGGAPCRSAISCC